MKTVRRIFISGCNPVGPPSFSHLCPLVESDVFGVDGDDLALAHGVLAADAALQDDQAVALVNLHLQKESFTR